MEPKIRRINLLSVGESAYEETEMLLKNGKMKLILVTQTLTGNHPGAVQKPKGGFLVK